MQVRKNNLSVLLRITPNFLGQIKTDLSQLCSQINELPCNLTVDFESQFILRVQHTPATFFGAERINGFVPVCEFPDRHFSESNNLRLIILLHELIHACQRQTVLLHWDKCTREKLREYVVFGQVAAQMCAPNKRTEIIRNSNAMKCLIEEFYKIIFEAWNHLLMREQFPEFFEQEMFNVHERIAHGTNDGTFDDWNEDFMFHMFAKLLEATFFAKIAENFQISQDYVNLGRFWRDKLRKVCTPKQFNVLINTVDTMTRTNEFPNSNTLEKQYKIFCQLLWERKVFENL